MESKLRKVILYHGTESSEKWPKSRRRLNLPNIQLLSDASTSELTEVIQFNSEVENLLRQRKESERQFDQWYRETFLDSKPKGLLEHLAPKKKSTKKDEETQQACVVDP